MDTNNLRSQALGIGPYENSRLRSPATNQARRTFFSLIDGFKVQEKPSIEFKSNAPADLARQVLPHFTACVLIHFALDKNLAEKSHAALYRHVKTNLTPADVRNFLPNQSVLKAESPQTHKKLTSWAKKWNLLESKNYWSLDLALEALCHWLFDPGAREFNLWHRAFPNKTMSAMWDEVIAHTKWKQFSFKPKGKKLKRYSFSSRGWNPLLEAIEEWNNLVDTWFEDKFKGQHLPVGIKGAFREQKRNHILLTKQRRGLKPTPEKRYLLHFLWAVHFQVGGLLLEDVCKLYDKPSKTVSDGINRTLELIGLTKRKIHGGRKIGTRRARQLSQREESNKKSRLSRFLQASYQVNNHENKAEWARAIGISPEWFRADWVPFLMAELRCGDFNAVIRKVERLKSTRH